MTESKIHPLLELSSQLETVRQQGKRVVHCHGVFDLLHVGHIKHLESARRKGDFLVVTVTPDRFVNKGPDRPVFNEQLRAEALAALACVDAVAINEWPTAVETLGLLRPHLYCKGSEYAHAELDVTGKIHEEEQAVKAGGGELCFTDDPTFSSSNLLNRFFSNFPESTRAYLREFGTRYRARDLIELLDRARDLRVLVVGETIIDEYHYCEAIGKSSKEPTLVVKSASEEKFPGGILAVAKHVASFSDHVAVLTMLGAQNSQQEYIEASLDPRIERHFLFRQDAPTIVKRRFVEQYHFSKLLEVYEINDFELSDEDNLTLCNTLRSLLPNFDLVIVVDYGHSFLSLEAIDLLSDLSPFLAINTQSNAGNLGYHTMSLYKRTDYVTCTEGEIRLEARRRRGDLRNIMKAVANRLSYPRVIVTRGKAGCLGYQEGSGYCEVPAVAGQVVDRIGSGDAFLAVSALAAAQKAPLEVVALIGNAAGAQAVATVGNREPVNRVALYKQLETMLK